MLLIFFRCIRQRIWGLSTMLLSVQTDGLVMSNGFKPPITKPFNCQTSLSRQRIIPQTFLFVKPFIPKNPIQNAAKCPINIQKTRKKYRKVWYLFKKPEKRFEGFILYILGGFIMIFVIPAQQCLTILAMILGRGCEREIVILLQVQVIDKPCLLV